MGYIETFSALLLYAEVLAAIVLMLPFIPPIRWQQLFRSRALKVVTAYANYYFSVFIIILLVVFFDAIREVRKYSASQDQEIDPKSQKETVEHLHMRLFRAQRNFYIAGFALFLWLVIKRLVILISNTATLEAQRDAALKQATSASETARKLMEDADKSKEAGDRKKEDMANEERDEELSSLGESNKMLKEKLIDAENELESAKNDLLAMKKQAESTNQEYDRLLKEHAKLQAMVEGDSEGKKDS